MTKNWNKFKKMGGVLMSIFGLFALGGCAKAHAKPEYAIGFLNKTGHLLDSVSLYYGNDKVAIGGMMAKGGLSTYGSFTLSIPLEADVRWEENGKHHAVTVKLKSVVPKRFTGTIYFIINENGTVDVKPIKHGDKEAVVELMKGMRPKGEYRLGFINKTGRDLTAVSAYYGDERVGLASNLPTRAKVGYSGPLPPPIPSVAELRWNEDGASHVVKVKLEGTVPNGFEGRIFFVIKDDGTVDVKPIKAGDDEGAKELFK